MQLSVAFNYLFIYFNWEGFWWYRTSVKFWKSDSPLLTFALKKAILIDSNVSWKRKRLTKTFESINSLFQGYLKSKEINSIFKAWLIGTSRASVITLFYSRGFSGRWVQVFNFFANNSKTAKRIESWNFHTVSLFTWSKQKRLF